MISAGVGGRLKVIGSSIAIVASGPIPGSTPISVPRKQPMKQNHRFCHVSATLKPKMRLLKSSMLLSPEALDQRIRQSEAVDEDTGADDGQADGKQDHLAPFEFVARRGGEGNQEQHRGYE